MPPHCIEMSCHIWHVSAASANGMPSLPTSGPARQDFIAEVSRILDEGTARQETNEQMTGKIAHAASVSTLALESQNAGSESAGPHGGSNSLCMH